MTPERRLDQLEPAIGEALAQLDLHTAQLKRIAGNIGTVTGAIVEQSENITFLLTRVATISTEIAEMKTEQQAQRQQFDRIESQNTLILNILQGRSNN
jgi:hypothetical protein